MYMYLSFKTRVDRSHEIYSFVILSVFFFQAEIKIFKFSLVDSKMKIFKLGE